MFNQEQEIINWKKSLRKNRSLEDGYIEELEQHLRDEIEKNLSDGFNEVEAFEKAVQNIGAIETINEEYFKSSTTNKLSGRPPWQSPKWVPELVFYYFKFSLRNFRRNLTHSAINLLGLAISITCVIFILLYIDHELSYDMYHADNDRIFRVSEHITTQSDLLHFAKIGWPVGPAIQENYPQLEYYARVFLRKSESQIQFNNKVFYEKSLIFAENNLFNILTFNLISGKRNELLTRPNSIVITTTAAKKYFGKNNPVGEVLKVDNKDYIITGLIDDIPTNSHLKFEFAASLKTIEDYDWFSNWFGTECYTYIKLNKNVAFAEFRNMIEDIAHRYVDTELKRLQNQYRYELIPVSQIHWQTEFNNEIEAPGSINNLIMFGSIALLILGIASINYINLATAQSMHRAKEVGLRKVIGAVKRQLVSQFLGESFAFVILSVTLGTILAFLIIPSFNSLTLSSIEPAAIFQMNIVLILLIIILLIGFGAGLYPAIVLSGFQPIAVLRGRFTGTLRGKRLRKILVVFQFALTVLMIVGTMVISKQIDFMKNENLGFNKDQMLVIPAMGGADITENYVEVKNIMLTIPNVISATASSSVPGRFPGSFAVVLVGHEKEVNLSMDHIFIDPDFIPSYGLQIIGGRGFENSIRSDEASWNKEETVFIINESAMKRCGWNTPDEALGNYLITGFGGRRGRIIGVVKNFHYEGLQKKIEPAVFEWFPERFRALTLKVSMKNLSSTIHDIEILWNKFFPNTLMSSFFLNEEFNTQYLKEEQTSKLAASFTFVGIFIACLGLLGLVSFIVEQKTKEIGIRKSLGAKPSNILAMLTGEFIKWVFLGNLISWPVAYYLMENWLHDFAYKVTIGVDVFITAAFISMFFAFATILYKSLKSSFQNPINALRYE